MRRVHSFPLLLLIFIGLFGTVSAQEKPDYVPKPGQFPPPSSGTYFAGELVVVDHVNRRCGLRLDGDGDQGRDDNSPTHLFAMLPYGSLWYHGAPAELRDIPIGTHLHGYFYLPPEGDTTIPLAEGYSAKWVPKQNHAISLEDDFSFYERRGQAWKLVSIELTYDASSPHFPKPDKPGDLRKTPVTGKLKVVSAGQTAKDGRSGELTLEIDRSSHIWKGREFAALEDLAPEQDWVQKDNTRSAKFENLAPDQVVHVNLTWAPQWVNGQFHVADLWLDKVSREVATERQRQTHLHHIRQRWPAGWVDHVEHQEGGKGIVTITLFSGLDPSVYEQARLLAGAIAVAEKTRRTWWQDHDSKYGLIVDFKDDPNPPPRQQRPATAIPTQRTARRLSPRPHHPPPPPQLFKRKTTRRRTHQIVG